MTKMEEYKTNAFGRNGLLAVNPDWTVVLEGNDYEYGGYSNIGIRDAIEWLVMSIHSIPFGKVRSYCQENNPAAVFTLRKDTINGPRAGETLRFTYEEACKA